MLSGRSSVPQSHRTTTSDIFGGGSARESVRSAGGGAGYEPAREDAVDPSDPLELEHVVGYAGRWRHSLHCHAGKDTLFVTCLGANVAISDVTDPHQQEFLRAHDAEVSALAVSGSGALIASGQVGSASSPSQEAPVVVWDFATRRQLFNLFGVRGEVTHLSFSPDERFLAAAGSDKMLFVWDMETGDQMHGKAQLAPAGFLAWCPVRPAGRRTAYTLAYSVGRVVYMSPLEYEPRAMRHVLTPTPAKMPSGFERSYTAACVDPRGEFLLVGTGSGEMAIFNISESLYRTSIAVAGNGVVSMVSKPDFGVLVGAGDGHVKLFTGEAMRWQCATEVPLSGAVVGLTVASTNMWLLAGTSLGKIYRVNVGDGTGSSRSFRAEEQESSHVKPLTAISFDGRRSDRYCTASLDGEVAVWDLSDYKALHVGKSSSPVTSVWLDEDGLIFAGCEDGFLRCFEPGAKSSSWKLLAHRGKVNSIAGALAFLATGGNDAHVNVWSRRTRELLIQFTDHVKPVVEVALDVASPSLLHSVGNDRSLYTFDLKAERRIVGHQMNRMSTGNFTCLSQRFDSEQELITATTDGTLLFWDSDVLDKPVARIDLPTRVVINDVAVSPSGAFIAVASDDSVLRLYTTATGGLVSEKVGHSGRVVAVRWSPDERQLITVGTDCCTSVWNFYGAE